MRVPEELLVTYPSIGADSAAYIWKAFYSIRASLAPTR
jgi:hypothetical protein